MNLLALNNTWLPSNNTVLTLRYGYTRFIDNNTLSADFDPSTLGFSANFLNAIQVDKFPQIRATDYDSADFGRLAGAIDPVNINWHSWGVNGALTRLFGRHTLKFGADFRWVGLDFQSFQDTAGDFRFDRYFTSSNPLTNGTATSGNAFASFLLGYPSGQPGSESTMSLSQPLEVFAKYYGFYAQDDFRVNPEAHAQLRAAPRTPRWPSRERQWHHRGLRSHADASGAARQRCRQRQSCTRRIGVRGRRTAPTTYQGNPPAVKVSPRVGVVYSFNPKTVIRAGYGIYWAPFNAPAPDPTNYGQVGFNQESLIQQGQFRPTVNLTNPYPNGLLQPFGNSRGALTNVGSQVIFIDQDRTAPKVHQYSFDVNRELAGNIAVGFEYAGATGRRPPSGRDRQRRN